MASKKYLIPDNKLTFYEHVDVAAKMIKGNILYSQNMSLPKQLKNFCFAHTNSHIKYDQLARVIVLIHTKIC